MMVVVLLIVVVVIVLCVYVGNNLNLLVCLFGYMVEVVFVFGDCVVVNEVIGMIVGDEDVV